MHEEHGHHHNQFEPLFRDITQNDFDEGTITSQINSIYCQPSGSKLKEGIEERNEKKIAKL